jgi:hypothetical protein
MASIAVLAFTALPAIASAATVPFNASLNEGKLTLGAGTVINDQALVPAGSAITIAGSLDTTTGAVTVPVDGLTFPVSPFTVGPLSGTLASTATAPATGTFNPATGALTMDLQFTTVVNITSPASTCTITPINFSLTTGTGNPLGKYPAGSPLNATTGAVSLVGYQPAIPASTPNAGGCALLNTLAYGGQPTTSGSIELASVPVAPGTAALAASFSPGKVKVKKNKKAKTNVKVTNTGTASATGVRTCVTGTGGVKLKETCFDDGTVSQNGTVSHNVSAKASKSGSFKATVTSTNAGGASATAKVTVKKKKKK